MNAISWNKRHRALTYLCVVCCWWFVIMFRINSKRRADCTNTNTTAHTELMFVFRTFISSHPNTWAVTNTDASHYVRMKIITNMHRTGTPACRFIVDGCASEYHERKFPSHILYWNHKSSQRIFLSVCVGLSFPFQYFFFLFFFSTDKNQTTRVGTAQKLKSPTFCVVAQ